MTKLSTLALVAALTLVPSFAFAANVGASADVSAAASGAVGNAGANVSANGGASANFGDLISGLNAKGDDSATITSIGGVTTASTINVVPVSSLKASANADAHALANAEAKADDRLTKLRAAVHANAALEAALAAKGYADNQVVAVQVDAQSNVTIYVNDSKN
jgi:hypothetical protein